MWVSSQLLVQTKQKCIDASRTPAAESLTGSQSYTCSLFESPASLSCLSSSGGDAPVCMEITCQLQCVGRAAMCLAEAFLDPSSVLSWIYKLQKIIMNFSTVLQFKHFPDKSNFFWCLWPVTTTNRWGFESFFFLSSWMWKCVSEFQIRRPCQETLQEWRKNEDGDGLERKSEHMHRSHLKPTCQRGKWKWQNAKGRIFFFWPLCDSLKVMKVVAAKGPLGRIRKEWSILVKDALFAADPPT